MLCVIKHIFKDHAIINISVRFETVTNQIENINFSYSITATHKKGIFTTDLALVSAATLFSQIFDFFLVMTLVIKIEKTWIHWPCVHKMAKYKLTLPIPCISESCIKTNINLFFFHTSLWCLKRFYEGLKSLHKTFKTFIKPFEAPQRSVKKKCKSMFSFCPWWERERLKLL